MKRFGLLCVLLVLAIFLSLPVAAAHAIVIDYVATDLADTTPGEDLWEFTYTVSDHAFAADTGFTIYFDLGLYGLLDPAPSAPNSDWDVLTWDPDPYLPDDGAYDAYALMNGASLADPFTVSFIWLGAGAPGAQFFDVYDGLSWEVLESGETTAAPVPEPATLFLMATGLAGLVTIRKRIIQS